jgi:hypothetical protein
VTGEDEYSRYNHRRYTSSTFFLSTYYQKYALSKEFQVIELCERRLSSAFSPNFLLVGTKLPAYDLLKPLFTAFSYLPLYWKLLLLAELGNFHALLLLPGRHRQRGMRARNPPVINRRMNPLTALSDTEFKSHFRFDKESVNRLAGLLNLGRKNNRRRPLTPVQQVCLALNFYAGGHFTRIAGLCGGVSQKTAWLAIQRVTNQLCLLKAQYIRMPTTQEMEETTNRL